MNRERRKQIADALEKIGEAKTALEAVKDDEESAGENIPESMTERKEKNDAAVAALDEAIGNLEEAEQTLEGIE